jgi:hypothetical protein
MPILHNFIAKDFINANVIRETGANHSFHVFIL